MLERIQKLLHINNERGCFGGTSKPQMPPTPQIDPAPPAAPTEVESAKTAESKRNQVAALKWGAISTIRNQGGSQGLTGQGSDLNAQSQGKKTLGS